MSIAENILKINDKLSSFQSRLVAVTKMRSLAEIQELYTTGQKVFGENKVQELVPKYEALPKDIEWHLIGHLQTNKVKQIAPFIHTIQSIDSFKLLEEVNKQAYKNQRIINCFLQIYIAKEETKFGFDESEALELLQSDHLDELKNILITGVMGMATNTSDLNVVRMEFRNLKTFFDKVKQIARSNVSISELSMGMSQDYSIAVEEGSSIVRIGSAIFQ